MMTQAAAIAGIEERSKALDIPIYIICARAGIAPSTFYRWKDGAGTTFRSVERINAALDQIEAERRA